LYTIGEAADILGISIPTIRMYEREGLIIPHRKRSKHRRFSQSDMERIRSVRAMINNEKISIAGIRRMLSLIPCWKIKNCPDDKRAQCAAFTQHDKPCWMVSGKSWDCRSEQCRECVVYTDFASCSTLKQTIVDFTLPERIATRPASISL
jgi:MerR family transcriptional regulator/heat shock protein HspR